ncbi:MAG: hypothetical protein N4Q28_01020, partial [Lactobacillus iners]|nr:hypothetical protein [Lactobacillus iners]
FLQQRPSVIVALSTILTSIFGTVLPFVPSIAKMMKFGELPGYYIILVFILLVMYILLTTIIKKQYLKSEQFLI